MIPALNLTNMDLIPIFTRTTIFTGIRMPELKLLADQCMLENYKAE